ncbi:PREDICTED: uncharacterized protein LOC106302505 [Brassica oleracea var. oleracea]|uniref:uncharacterized protein LOC106302505 n=1 Tax=Brassica oleracea var. oleracea TaxID=109376 RepID=UPI0006A73A77|nr:PREDICTED: uncharacterized protein LOC106302505 [Brassica oleracea var. oleracea]
MSKELFSAMKSMTLEDDEPITLPDEPRFRVFDENSLSLLGRLLNPDCQSMSRMIEDMPKHWRLVGRVRGIALSREKFQFIFKREEDLQTVLSDRPWSFIFWTMLLERWTESPPNDFLTKFEVWIRIRNIPSNYYTIDTMFEMAKAIGEVKVVAYDPKVSQKADFIRAQVIFDISKPAREEKIFNLSAGKSVAISYEYEKIRKKCFHCFRLTHEKVQCPWLKNKHHNHRTPVKGSSSQTPPMDLTKGKSKEGETFIPRLLEGPPGFPSLFPELSKEDQQSAMLYISHADPTERLARIERVKQSIKDTKDQREHQRPIITTDISQGKGMVFRYTEDGETLKSISSSGGEQASKLGAPLITQEAERVESGASSSQSLYTESSTGFSMGASSKPSSNSGTHGEKKTEEQAPSVEEKVAYNYSPV